MPAAGIFLAACQPSASAGVAHDDPTISAQVGLVTLAQLRADAENGDDTAQNQLGFMYQKGQGVAKDDTQAVSWFRKAAEQGYPNAQYNLGVRYQEGKGVPKDEAQAKEWFRKAAAQGNPDAQKALAK